MREARAARSVDWTQPIARVDDALRLVEASYERGSARFAAWLCT
ncbi:MAG TPA: hypothetical protein VMR50_13045 [Myxococcota bacterium]|nr:hypothetical protein [Myxococcota bacterium]